jgi:hypothetical protein
MEKQTPMQKAKAAREALLLKKRQEGAAQRDRAKTDLESHRMGLIEAEELAQKKVAESTQLATHTPCSAELNNRISLVKQGYVGIALGDTNLAFLGTVGTGPCLGLYCWHPRTKTTLCAHFDSGKMLDYAKFTENISLLAGIMEGHTGGHLHECKLILQGAYDDTGKAMRGAVLDRWVATRLIQESNIHITTEDTGFLNIATGQYYNIKSAYGIQEHTSPTSYIHLTLTG